MKLKLLLKSKRHNEKNCYCDIDMFEKYNKLLMKNSKDYCPNCQTITNHKCLFNKNEKSHYDDDFHWEENYDTIECLGCENIQFRKRYSDEAMIRSVFDGQEEYVEQYDESKYYPKNIVKHKLLKDLYQLPEKLRVIYIESIESLKNNCYLLAGVGLRAIIEAICLDMKIDGKNLEMKINNLLMKKLITEKDGNRLHSIRFLGNDSVHEMDVPSEEKLGIALDIVEHLIKNLYLVDIDAKKHLDTIISQYDDFKNLVLRRFLANTIVSGSEMNLREILKRDFRRIESSYYPNFEQQFIDEVDSIANISIGKIEGNQKYFIKK